jgi:type VI secretion system secreted protein VgrG
MSGSSSSPARVTVTLTPPPSGVTLEFESLRGKEELGRPYLYALELTAKQAKPDLTAILGGMVVIAFANGQAKRYVTGYVARASFEGMRAGAYLYRLELRPWIWLLSRVQNSRIFQNVSIWSIITTIFQEAGFSGNVTDSRQNSAGSQVVEYCVQYNETSMDFVTRLMEKYGLYYYFTHSSDGHNLVVADDPNSHTALSKTLPYANQQTEFRQVDAHVWGWSSDLAFLSGAVTFNDYNFKTPGNQLLAKSLNPGSHPKSSYEVYEYPGPYGVINDGTKIAGLRMQHIAARRSVVHASSNSRDLTNGCKFTLSDFDDTTQNKEWLVIEAELSLTAGETVAEKEGETADAFLITITAIPGTTPFGLEETTPWPCVNGPQTALVVGKSGDEITTDQYGRVIVSFYWDRNSQKNETSSCYIRVAQVWAANGWGATFIPRIGQEVIVEFIDGNPDRPLITGCVYNGTNALPYPPSGDTNATRSTIKSNSSKGGNGFNELRFEDKAGSEEVFFQAQKDYNWNVINNETGTVGQNSTVTVTNGNRVVNVSAGYDSLTVSKGNQTITVSSGSSTITAGTAISLVVGSNSFVLDTSSATITVGASSVKLTSSSVTVNGGNISLSATEGLTANGGAEMTLQAGEIAIN